MRLHATLRGSNRFGISRDAILALARDSRVRAGMRVPVDVRENTFVPTIPVK